MNTFHDSTYQNPYSVHPSYTAQTPYSNQVPPVEPPTMPSSKKHKNKHAYAALFLACLLCSSAAGFGGGYFAAIISDAQPTAAQNPSTAANTQTTASLPVATTSTDGVMTVSQVVSAVSDSVVEINTEVQKVNFLHQTVTGQSAGSGVILSEDGYIITNNHVIEDAQNITVRLKNEQSYPATLIGTDTQTDIAVIKIEATGLQAAKIGDSSSLQVGDDAIAIGNPLGELGGTVTNGIISAVSREVTIGNETMTLLQTNAAINPGNSGGGLFNNRGELIGIVVAKTAGSGVEGLGFAIPIDTAQSVASDLISYGYVTGRGALGVSVIDIADTRTAFMYRVPQMGVYIAGITADSAAQTAGLKVGDGILAVGENAIENSQELKTELEKYKAGDTVELTVLRDGATHKITVTLEENVPASVQQKTFAA